MANSGLLGLDPQITRRRTSEFLQFHGSSFYRQIIIVEASFPCQGTITGIRTS